jgi:hypothetical protein
MNNTNTQEILKLQLLCDIVDSLKQIELLIIEKERSSQNYEMRLNDLYHKYDDLNRKFRATIPLKNELKKNDL